MVDVYIKKNKEELRRRRVGEHELIEMLLSLLIAICGWVIKVLWGAVRVLKNDIFALNEKISEVREELPKQYIQKDDYKSDISDIKNMLTRLFEKIDGKADK